MDSLERHRESFRRLRNRRIAAREVLSPALRQSYDETLSQLLPEAFYKIGDTTPGCNPKRKVVKLLNKGATASCLNPYELGGPNLGDLVDILHDTSSIEPLQVFTLLDHIVASPCDSWATNRRYVGNGGSPLPPFLMSTVVTADVWGSWHARRVQSLCVRFRAWCSLQKMIWAYEDDLAAERLPTRRRRLVASLFSDFLGNVSCMEKRYTFCDIELRLLDAVVAFFKPRTALIISETEIMYFYIPFLPFAAELLLRTDKLLFQKYYDSYTVKQVFNTFCMSKQSRKKTLKLLSYPEFRRWILCEESVRELCRRKERVIFEELYLRDAKRLMVIIPFALSILESKDVRGCKHRLIKFLRDVLLTNVGNEGVSSSQADSALLVEES